MIFYDLKTRNRVTVCNDCCKVRELKRGGRSLWIVSCCKDGHKLVRILSKAEAEKLTGKAGE